ncbi:MAG: methyltransferase [Bacteriovoracia bacterium]
MATLFILFISYDTFRKMNLSERFLQIRDFLKPYQRIWQNEIMLMYPDPLSGYPLEWIEDLRRFKAKSDVIRLEKKDVFDLISSPSLISFYREIEALCSLPQKETYPPLPEDSFTWLFMIPKKQHEIRNLAPHLNHLYRKTNVDEMLDIGGGIGLLAQTMNNYYQTKITSLDMDPILQKTGKTRHEKNAKDPLNKVLYKNVKVEDQGEFSELLNRRIMPVGLHTCGKLALDIIRVSAAKKVPAMVNFGCCYHTLDKTPDLQNLSRFAKDNDPIWINKFALTLSCRAHRKMDEKDYDLKLKVKLYRYAIHILLHDHYGIKELVTLGNSSPKLYDETFGVYAYEQFKRIHLSPTHSIEELNSFFEDSELQILIERMLAAGLIRNALGRVMEIYLLLDRAIYLQEQGYKVQVQEFFDEELSPRNIGITAVL